MIEFIIAFLGKGYLLFSWEFHACVLVIGDLFGDHWTDSDCYADAGFWGFAVLVFLSLNIHGGIFIINNNVMQAITNLLKFLSN